MNAAALDAITQEAWPVGLPDRRRRAHVDLALVRRTWADSPREARMLDQLERANRRALQAWHDSGRTL